MRDMWTVTLIQSESFPPAFYLDRIAEFSSNNEVNVFQLPFPLFCCHNITLIDQLYIRLSQ